MCSLKFITPTSPCIFQNTYVLQFGCYRCDVTHSNSALNKIEIVSAGSAVMSNQTKTGAFSLTEEEFEAFKGK